MYCRFCGKEIPNNSIFCPNCGKKQEGEPSKIDFQLFQGLGKYKKWGIIYIIWCLIHIGLLISAPSQDMFEKTYYMNKTDAFYPFETSLSEALQSGKFECYPLQGTECYDFSELFFYTILFPLLICGLELLCRKVVSYITKLSQKKSNGKQETNIMNPGKILVTIGFFGFAILGSVVLWNFLGNNIKSQRTEQAPPIDTDSLLEDSIDFSSLSFEGMIIHDAETVPSKTEQDPPVDLEDDLEDEESVIDDDIKFSTGDTPYSHYYGSNMVCRQSECSGVKVTAPELSDVVVIIKKNNKNGKVAGHAYISAGDTYKINLPNGTYQTFFYYGDRWSPYKDMGNGVKGGFIYNELFSKDKPQEIYNAVLTYVLQLRRDGNFQAESSNRSELF